MAPPQAPPPPKRHHRVRLRIADLPIGKTTNLQPYLFKLLQEQDPAGTISVTIDVVSSAGIGEEALNQRIVEGLEQLNIGVSWEPE